MKKSLIITLFLALLSFVAEAKQKYGGQLNELPDSYIVEYEYDSPAEGGRIWNGTFKAMGDITDEEYIVNGFFKNGNRNGKWTYENYDIYEDDIERNLLTINYKDGLIVGRFTLVYSDVKTVYNKKTRKNDLSYTPYLTFTGKIVDGNFVDTLTIKYDYTERGKKKSDIQRFYFNADGTLRDGSYALDDDGYRYRITISDGEVTKGTIEDLTSGDLSDNISRAKSKYQSYLSNTGYRVMSMQKMGSAIFTRGLESVVSNFEIFPTQRDIKCDVRLVGTVNEDQSEPTVPQQVFTAVEVSPSFPGGEAALMKYLSTHLQYPADAKARYAQGRVIVRFIIDKTGEVTNPVVIRSVDPDLDREAIRVIKSLPRFTPGKVNGEAVKTYYTLPVTFKLN